MSETPNDPSGTTHQFKNFAAQRPAEKSASVNTGLIAGVAAVVVLVAIITVVGAMML